MKKLTAILVAIFVLFSLAACGKTSVDTAPTEQEKEQTQPTVPDNAHEESDTLDILEEMGDAFSDDTTNLIEEDTYYGTWKVERCEKNGETKTTKELEDSGNYTFSHTVLVIRNDGKINICMPLVDGTGEWKVSENGITVGDEEIRFENDRFVLDLDDNTVYFLKDSEDMTFPDDRTIGDDYLYGTWSVVGGYISSDELALTLAELKSSYSAFSESVVIFSDEGTAYVKMGDDITTGEWTYKEGVIQLGNFSIALKGNLIYVPCKNGDFLYFEKTSEEQAIPEIADEAGGIRHEFKEAMDSYEAFFDEYCEFMKKFENNPSDLSLLVEYSSMLIRLSEMEEEFDAWEDEDLSNEELAYYLEVSNRISQKLLEVL